MFMNEFDIEEAMQRYQNHPVLAEATQVLNFVKNETNSHSDGWAYWQKPLKACRKLMELIQRGSHQTSHTDLQRAYTPIRAFYTRYGNKAEMRMPLQFHISRVVPRNNSISA